MLSKHCLIGPLVFLELKQKKGHLLKDTKMVKYESPNHYKYKITIFYMTIELTETFSFTF